MTHPTNIELIDLVKLKSLIDLNTMLGNKKNSSVGIGENKSLFKSRGLNFQEIRQYQPGDDIRQIDWRVTAKYGKPFTKLYQEEKERGVYILCDLRANMQFASHGHFKSVVAARISAFLGFLAEKHNDTLTYQILSDKIDHSLHHQSTKDALPFFLNQLCKKFNNSLNNISIKEVIHFIEQNVRPGSLLFFLSDFHDIDKETLEFIGHQSLKNTVVLLHIYDKMEMELPNKGLLPFSNGIDEASIDTSEKSLQKVFYNSWKTRIDLLNQYVKKYQMNYFPLLTDEDYVKKFQQFLLRIK